MLTTRVRPAASSGQQPFASLGVAKLQVTGCPLKELPNPETLVAADTLSVSNVVKYSWAINVTSDSSDPLVVRQSSARDVTIKADVVRSPGQRSVRLQGVVQVSAQGTQKAAVKSVQVCLWCTAACIARPFDHGGQPIGFNSW